LPWLSVIRVGVLVNPKHPDLSRSLASVHNRQREPSVAIAAASAVVEPAVEAHKPVSDLFSPFTLKDVTLRNRIAMSPMTRVIRY
jgi:hypothetical protein